MPAPIEFYFDFSSPFGYLASEKIDTLAAKHGRTVLWRPFLLGATFKTTGLGPLVSVPMKGDYSRHDFMRSARLLGVTFKLPSNFPVGTVSAARAFYWLDNQDPARATARCGLDAAAVATGINDAAVKERTKVEVDKALAKGVFGSPFTIIDGEPFWGSDRLDQIDRWLATGGW
jgi:2-hydroxychromene-2-carboxylate isomerase